MLDDLASSSFASADRLADCATPGSPADDRAKTVDRWTKVALRLLAAREVRMVVVGLRSVPSTPTRVAARDGQPPAPSYLAVPLLDARARTLGQLVAADHADRVWSSSDIATLNEVASALVDALSTLDERAERQELELRLQRRVSMYEALIEASAEIVWMTDPRGFATDPSPTWERFTGQSDAEWRGVGWLAVVHPDDHGRVRAFWERAFETRATATIEYRLRHHSGEWRWIHERAVPLFSKDAVLQAWLGMSFDIDERRRSDGVLRAVEARQRALIEAVSVMTWFAGPDGILVEGDPSRWCDFTGQTLEEWHSRRWLDVVHPHDRSLVEQMWSGRPGAAQNAGYEYRIRHKSGCWRWVFERVVPMAPGSDGEPSGFVGMTSDIDGKKKAQLDLKESEARNRALVEASSQIVWACSADGQFIEDSPSWRAFTGISIEDWLAGSWIKDVHPDDASATIARWSTLLADGKAVDLEYRVRHHTGGWRHVIERVVPLHGEDGRVASWVGMSSDVTEQKEARLALEEHERLLRKALKAAGMTAWTWNLQNDTLCFSHLDHDVLGVGQQHVSSSALTSRLLPADAYLLNSALEKSLTDGTTFELTCALQSCGSPRWIKIAGQSEGSERARGILWDVTTQVLTEERRNLLVGEIAHRGKNLLAVIQAMAGITLNDSRPITLSRTMFLERLAALSRSHSMLTQNDWEGVPIDEIVRGELLSHIDRIELTIPPVLLNPSSAQSIALVVHELATNAAKHGALSVPGGRIRVHAEEVETDGSPSLRFLWHEQGGPPVAAPARSGFGSMLLRRLIQGFDTGGVIEYRRDGLIVQVDMPIAMITPQHEALSAGARPDH